MIETEIKVQWGEMDSFGHVNNVHYIRYLEIGRIEYFMAINFAPKMLRGQEAGIGPILKKIDCIYHKPVNYPATLVVTTSVTTIGNTSLILQHEISNKKSGETVAEGESVVVNFNYQNNSTVPISKEIRLAIETLQNQKM